LTDWGIIKKLAVNIWPKSDTAVKVRVVGALGLLVGGKLLNVQVPFFFKDIVDSLSLPVTDASTVWMVVGWSILGCTFNTGLVRHDS
jgi:ATP-binding cassette subfamily B (MDR/TAP) protein 7